MPPRVSVLLCVHNGADRLRRTIDSVLTQSLCDLELIVVDDGSTDATPQVLETIDDPRVRRARHENRGLTAALNVALRMARGPFIARQDCGDASRPRRLALQAERLEAEARLGLAGCWAALCLPDGAELMIERRPTDNATLQARLPEEMCVFGAAAMFRRSAIDAVGGYCEAFRYAQDYDLCLRVAEQFELAALPEVLYDCEAPLRGGISLDQVAEQLAYAAAAQDAARQRRAAASLMLADDAQRFVRNAPSPADANARTRDLIEQRLAAIRPADRRGAQARRLDCWARRLWDIGRRRAAARLWARSAALTAAHPGAWSAGLGGLRFVAGRALRKLRRVAPGGAIAPQRAPRRAREGA